MSAIFQGRQEDLPTYEQAEEGGRRDRRRWMTIGPESEFFAPLDRHWRTRQSRGVKRDASERTLGVPSPTCWGSLCRWGSGRAAGILSCNGVDVTPVERVQRWEDTLWKARLADLARPRSHP